MIRSVDRWMQPGAVPVNGLRLRHPPHCVNASDLPYAPE